MRIQQTAVMNSWLTKSQDPAECLRNWIAGAPSEILIDDQGLRTKIKPLEVVAPDEKTGIAFFAKDADTMSRGFTAVANRTEGKREYYLRERTDRNLAALWIRWDTGSTRNTSALAAGLSTVGHNIVVGTKMAVFQVIPHVSLGGDRFQSVSDNVRSVGRDSKMLERGVGLFICPAQVMPNNLSWGRTYRNISDKLTMSTLATIVGLLSEGEVKVSSASPGRQGGIF